MTFEDWYRKNRGLVFLDPNVYYWRPHVVEVIGSVGEYIDYKVEKEIERRTESKEQDTGS